MNILIFVLIGLCVGWISRSTMHDRGLGTWMDVFMAILGAFFGGFSFKVLGADDYGYWSVIGLSAISSVAFVLLTSFIPRLHASQGQHG